MTSIRSISPSVGTLSMAPDRVRLAKSNAYSASVSGTYLVCDRLFTHLGRDERRRQLGDQY